MILRLRQLPASTRGIYGPNRNILPKRALFLHPDAAQSFVGLGTDMVYSDVFRSAESSLAAVDAGRGAQPPAYSAHNYGFAVDVAVDQTIERTGWSYATLLKHMATHGWHCYRRDEKRGREDWHFNYLGDRSDVILSKMLRGAWEQAAEEMIQAYYGPDLHISDTEMQQALAKLGMYQGEIDGLIGPISRSAMEAFARAWKVQKIDGPRFRRTLAYVAAEKQIDTGGVG